MIILVHEESKHTMAVLDTPNTRASPSFMGFGVWEVNGVQKLCVLILIIFSQAILFTVVFVIVVPFNSCFDC